MERITKTKAWRRLKAVMNRVGRRHETIDEAEIEQDVLEAVKAVRKESNQTRPPV